MRRTVGSLFPQSDRLDDRLGRGWAAVASDERTRGLLEAEGLQVTDAGPDRDWLERRSLTWALLRPDRFVFACGGPADVRAGAAAWRRIAPAAPVEVAA
jgi:3-(3-hydroxy-phenyl)propionate hydroxylase